MKFTSILFLSVSLLVLPQNTFGMEKVADNYIGDLDKKELLRALYAYATPQGKGYLQYQPNNNLTDNEVEQALKKSSIDYLNGRVMKVDLSGSSLNTWLYNRDNGVNAAEKVIAQVRAHAQQSKH